jgi:predicted ATP-grasp superfamily ATP-dependent carboligase
MKAAQTLQESLGNLAEVTTQGDLRRIVANSLLALARKEISSADVEAMAKGLDSISNSLNAEIKVAKTAIELREKGADLGKVTHLGSMLIGHHDPKGS